MRLLSFLKQLLVKQPGRFRESSFGHRFMMVLLFLLLVASTAVLRLLWHGEKVHSDRLSNAYQQYHTAQMLLESGSQQDAAALWKLHWTATQQRFADYSNKDNWPRLFMLYHERPYRLNERIEEIGGRANDGISSPREQLLNPTLVSGLQAVLHELQTKPPTDSFVIKLAALFIFPAFCLWALLYHWLVHRRLVSESNHVAGELQRKYNQLDTLTYNDPLTETSNRKAITQFLSHYQTGNNGDAFVALAILDLDYFQQINDVFGYFAGDAVLREIAERIGDELRDEDQLGRLDADRYAIVLCDLTSPKNAEEVIDRIQRVVADPIHFQKNTLNLTCTVGVAVQHVNAIDIADLFKLSDQALFRAKQHRRGSVFLLSDQQQEALSRQRQIINTLKNNPPEEIFDLVFQPIVDINTRLITGCECLLRWTADKPEHLGASELVPILEMFGDINEVGLWVLRKSLQQLRTWQDRYHIQDFVMSVNISARQMETEDLAAQIAAITQELELQPHNIALELTETVAMKHLEAGRHQLAQLRNHGFNISLDDFGTGYSSLQYLKNIPASSVKIDQSFVKEFLNDDRDMAIVKGAIDIAWAIGLVVIAEGIATEEQVACLQQLGCHKGQGFIFSKPLSAAEFEYQLAPRVATVNHNSNNPSAA